VRRSFGLPVLTLAAMIASGCASLPPVPPAYRVSVLDEPQNHRFVFRFVSSDDRDLCLDADNWPTVYDNVVSSGLELITATGTIRARSEVFLDAGMGCGRSRVRDCGVRRVEAHGTREVALDYMLFGDPETLAKDAAKHFDLHPNFPNVEVCRPAHLSR
jgi:hypothetical protein